MNPILQRWSFKTTEKSEASILPDGCRDLIMRTPRGSRPQTFVTTLDESARNVSVESGETFVGFRLQPGVEIDEAGLLTEIDGIDPDSGNLDSIVNRLYDHCSVSTRVSESLESLAITNTVAEAASELGISTRTLQRTVAASTGKSPAFWLQLARVRRAARAIRETKSLTELAIDCCFADQSHMTREFRRWFSVSPTQFTANAELVRIASSRGYE